MSNIAIKVSNISKHFILPHQRANTLKSFFVNPFNRFDNETQTAFEDLSFEVKKGEFFGIVGRNGSGKSTLLKCIAGVYSPDQGKISVHGKLVPFIELGVGFNPELTGRDNVYLNGALLGFNRVEIDAMYDEIVAFAELEKFMDQKLKNYSSGMQVRLAFSIAIQAKGDILLLDEVLAVGDTIFQQKCFSYFNELKRENKTVILVSHDTNALRRYCTAGILIDGGRIVSSGLIDDVLDDYTGLVSREEEKAAQADKHNKGKRTGIGTGKVLVSSVDIKDQEHEDKRVFTDSDEYINVSVVYNVVEDVESPTFGIVVKDASGNKLIASNNLWSGIKSVDLRAGQLQRVTWTLQNMFNTGEYFVSPAVADESGNENYDWVHDAATFRVRKSNSSSGLINPKHNIKLHGASTSDLR